MQGSSRLDVQHDADRGRFSVEVEGAVAHIDYRRAGPGLLDFRSTFVPPRLRGRGIGSALVIAALEQARERGERVIPTCPFVAAVVEQHPELAAIVA
jgi:predicted GNAT family acetyltransferase